MGPIILSALSLFLSFLILQPLALFLDPTFNLLASRGIGKVIFISMAIFQILLFLSIQQKKFLKDFFDRVFFFFVTDSWFRPFSYLFALFFVFHASILFLFYQLGYLFYNPTWGDITLSVVGKTIFGLFVVFMLAWTEELIFRGTIYPYFRLFYSPITSALTTSLIFMLVHNLRNPLKLISTDWKLGLGLFLLGLLLNQVFIITKKLYTGMGIHAGLVFVKVILRRAPFLSSVPDLRQSHIVHILFILTITYIFVKYRKSFFTFDS
jgi:membrane protease YdiL (CAAX protease family)